MHSLSKSAFGDHLQCLLTGPSSNWRKSCRQQMVISARTLLREDRITHLKARIIGGCIRFSIMCRNFGKNCYNVLKSNCFCSHLEDSLHS